MATVTSYFDDFLKGIRPTKDQRDDLKTGHKTLRDRLNADAELSPIIHADFLQGSYRRSTVVRPKGGQRSDVDIIVVTKIDKDEYSPDEAMDKFIPFLDKYYKGKWRPQGRSFGIELSYVEMDLVITAAPSQSVSGILTQRAFTSDFSLGESDDLWFAQGWLPPEDIITFSERTLVQKALTLPEWKIEPLWIPDREAGAWEETHPIAQIQWTRDKNKSCNKLYLGTVQALKWWKRRFEDPKYPKGYPLEHLIGASCPNGITSVAEGVVLTLEYIASAYAAYASAQIAPSLPDHGVPHHNVMARVLGEDFAAFHSQAVEDAKVAREAFDEPDTTKSVNRWRDLFGTKFPEPPPGFSERKAVSTPSGGRFG